MLLAGGAGIAGGIIFIGILTLCDGDVFTGSNPSVYPVAEVKK
jgi:hypothetical protein